MSPERDAVLALREVSRSFTIGWRRRRRTVLRDVTLEAYPGEILGLLGRNGAGKTTLMKIALGLLRPTGGTGTLLGRALGDLEARRRTGFLPEEPYFHPALTVRETLEFMAGLSRLPRAEARRRTGAAMDRCGLLPVSGTAIRKLSRGWLRRVGLAAAILADPEVLFLDEPLSGLDPEARLATKDLIRDVRRAGGTVIMSSHMLPDVESLADRVALLGGGGLIDCRPLHELLEQTTCGYRIEVAGPHLLPPDWSVIPEVRGEGASALTRYRAADLAAVQRMLRGLASGGARVSSVVPLRESLEELFVRLSREEERAGGACHVRDGGGRATGRGARRALQGGGG